MGKAGAAFSAAAGQHLLPGPAAHTLKKTVFAGALSFLWLISLLWHRTSIIYEITFSL